MCYIDKGDSQFLMHSLQFQLHLFSHLQIQSSQRLVKQKDLRLIDNGTGNGNTLLLTAGQSCNAPLLKAFQINDLECMTYLLANLFLGQLLLTGQSLPCCILISNSLCFQLQSKRNIVKYIQMWK